jgi:hypothetical protein
MTKFLDWKGNEIKAGMTIYFVRTKPMLMGRLGWMIPNGKGEYEQRWEPQEQADERNNKDYWILGEPCEVVEMNNELWYQMKGNDGYTFSFQLRYKVQENTIVAIKGISDEKPSQVADLKAKQEELK